MEAHFLRAAVRARPFDLMCSVKANGRFLIWWRAGVLAPAGALPDG